MLVSWWGMSVGRVGHVASGAACGVRRGGEGVGSGRGVNIGGRVRVQ